MQQYEQKGSPSRVFFTVSDMNATSSDTSYGCMSELIRITIFVCRRHHTVGFIDPRCFGLASPRSYIEWRARGLDQCHTVSLLCERQTEA